MSAAAALHRATVNRDFVLLAKLLSNGADPNAKFTAFLPLIAAMRAKSKEAVKLLLENGANVNSEDGLVSPLEYSLKEHCSDEIIDLLLAAGASVHHEVRGATPLSFAAETGNVYAVRRLLAAGANVDGAPPGCLDAIYCCPLFSAARACASTETISLLLQNGASLRGEYSIVFHHLALNPNLKRDMFVFLLEAGADINARNTRGFPPIWEAIHAKQFNLAEWLIEAGADLTKTDENRNTLLHYICKTSSNSSLASCKSLVRYLIMSGLDPDARNFCGATPLHVLCSRRGAPALLEVFIECGANVDAVDYAHDTPLHIAAREGSSAEIAILLQEGADTKAINSSDVTPLALVRESGEPQLLELMNNRVQKIN